MSGDLFFIPLVRLYQNIYLAVSFSLTCYLYNFLINSKFYSPTIINNQFLLYLNIIKKHELTKNK